MATIQIVLRVNVTGSILEDKGYWLFLWRLNNRSAEICEILDIYTKDMAHLLFKNPVIITKEEVK